MNPLRVHYCLYSTITPCRPCSKVNLVGQGHAGLGVEVVFLGMIAPPAIGFCAGPLNDGDRSASQRRAGSHLKWAVAPQRFHGLQPLNGSDPGSALAARQIALTGDQEGSQSELLAIRAYSHLPPRILLLANCQVEYGTSFLFWPRYLAITSGIGTQADKSLSSPK
jgi:hypothetical protein